MKEKGEENQEENQEESLERENAYYVKMTTTPVSKLIIKLGIPTIISMLVTSLYNMVDTYFVGTIGTSASAAVGVVFGLMAIIQALGFMFGHGAGSIIARKLGSKEGEVATQYASTCFFCSIVSGVLLGTFGLLFLEPFMRLLGSTDTILPYSSKYSLFILLTAPIMTVSFTLNNLLRYEGKSILSMFGLVTGGVLNMFGDYLLIRVFGMGIEGAGLSTAVSQVISFGILLYPFLTGKTQTRIALKYVRYKDGEIFHIMATGLPSLLRQGMNSISTMVLNGQAAVYGDAAVAAMSIVGRICFFIFAVGLGIGQGFQPVSSYNYGAKKYSRVRRGCFFTMGFGTACIGFFACFAFLCSNQLIGWFRDDPEVIAIGTYALKWQLAGVIIQPISVSSNMMFQSTGHNIAASLTAVLRSGILFIPLVILLPGVIGLTGVQIAQPLADVGTTVITLGFLVWFLRILPADGEEIKH